jgi:subtilase family serine protease
MASRKRSRRPFGFPRRERRSLLPLLENLENRLVLSLGNPPLVPPNLGLVPVPLVQGGTAWLDAPGAVRQQLQASLRSSHGTTPPLRQPTPLDPGVLLGHLPVASPVVSGGPAQLPGPAGFVPLQIQTAYGLSTGSAYNNNISFGGTQGNGAGQTIAIFEEGSNPAFLGSSDPHYHNPNDNALAFFDRTFGLPDPPSLTFYDQTGKPITPSNPGPGDLGAGLEIALDIEWAHAMAPEARIDVVNDDFSSLDAIFQGMATAATLPGVSVVSISYLSFFEAAGKGSTEVALDNTYLAPALATNPHATFFAASGDFNVLFDEGPSYPSISPLVVSVGGTSLFLTKSGQWGNEVGWAGSGGGISNTYPEPPYQQNDGFDSGGFRTNPDVAADADPSTGVAVYDPFDFGTATPWVQDGGTSLATPLWAGMAAIADQGRVLAGGKPLGSTAMLTDLYNLANVAPGDFHDITQGNNGFPAGPGYDLVTGLGSPKANLLVPDLAAYGLASQSSLITQAPPSVVAGANFGIIASPADDFGATDYAYTGVATLSLVSGPAGPASPRSVY